MELIPCIQTLAHLNAIVRWPAYSPHVDTSDILLAGDEAVYELIDKMFATVSKCFTSRIINIGMDEAHMIGRGKYYDIHGDTDRSQILIDHVKKVSRIGKKASSNTSRPLLSLLCKYFLSRMTVAACLLLFTS